MQLQYDTQDQVPEDLRESFVEFQDGEKTLFMHKDLAETKKEAYRFKGDLTQAQKAAEEKAAKLKEFEDEKLRIEEERQKAELESKKKNGQHEEILEHYKQQAEQEKTALQQQLDELQNNIKSEKKNGVVSDLAVLGTDSTRATLKRLINLDLDFAEDGNLVVMQDGKATSLTIDEYKAKLPELYPHLVGESHGKGGQGNGGNGSGQPAAGVNKAAQDAAKKGDLNGYLSQALKFN